MGSEDNVKSNADRSSPATAVLLPLSAASSSRAALARERDLDVRL